MSSEESNEMMEARKEENLADVESAEAEEETAQAEGEAEPDEKATAPDDVSDTENPSEEETDTAIEVQPEASLESEEAQSDTAGEEEEAATEAFGAGDTSNVQQVPRSDEEPFSDERIRRILDIELPVNISFGSTKRPLSEVLKLGPGALLELDRAAEEPVVLKVNNRVFAKGEIVDIDGYYGVQITEISSPAQRIASLGE